MPTSSLPFLVRRQHGLPFPDGNTDLDCGASPDLLDSDDITPLRSRVEVVRLPTWPEATPDGNATAFHVGRSG